MVAPQWERTELGMYSANSGKVVWATLSVITAQVYIIMGLEIDERKAIKKRLSEECLESFGGGSSV